MTYETGLSMEERVSSLFQPDTLLPDQYLETFRRKLHLEPEKKLMLAILEDAIACYQKYLFARDLKGKALFHEAEEWVEEGGGRSVFAFDSVCEILGLNPNYLRRGLTDWKKAAVARRSQAKMHERMPRPRRNAAMARRATRRPLRRAAGR
ncbi:MAG TPA: hypothetical protein VJQ55_10335 [Candidatus Binatia bacterium]|nr:hypothetical protein [Candidatus Binatia bacterium]